MPDIVGVRRRRAAPVEYFDAAGLDLQVGDHVVVQTDKGPEIGQVVIAPNQVLAHEVPEPAPQVLRKATAEDLKQQDDFKRREFDVLTQARERVQRRGLPMDLLTADHSLDGGYLTITFAAEGRVDFRELLRDLASIFRCRIELHQVGPRDQAKMLGGIGRCGRALCCAGFLTAFNPITVRMARDQDLPPIPEELAGLCGRLRCCLRYELEQYLAMKQEMPRSGRQMITPLGRATVLGGNLLKERVTVRFENAKVMEFPLDQVSDPELLKQWTGQAQGTPKCGDCTCGARTSPQERSGE